MSVVIDTSVTLAWVYSEETTRAVERVLDMVSEHGAVVPALWRLDVANVLESSVGRSRTDAAFRDSH